MLFVPACTLDQVNGHAGVLGHLPIRRVNVWFDVDLVCRFTLHEKASIHQALFGYWSTIRKCLNNCFTD